MFTELKIPSPKFIKILKNILFSVHKKRSLYERYFGGGGNTDFTLVFSNANSSTFFWEGTFDVGQRK